VESYYWELFSVDENSGRNSSKHVEFYWEFFRWEFFEAHGIPLEFYWKFFIETGILD
jgi:hypothetical protein